MVARAVRRCSFSGLGGIGGAAVEVGLLVEGSVGREISKGSVVRRSGGGGGFWV